jgi:hypothetical protein
VNPVCALRDKVNNKCKVIIVINDYYMANLVKNIQHAKQKQTATQNAAASLSKFFASKHALAVLYSMH